MALLGGATGLVGDPSGKSAERPVLSDEQATRNIAGIRAILEDLLQRQPDRSSDSNGSDGSNGIEDFQLFIMIIIIVRSTPYATIVPYAC